jgi:hypothetical protein
MTKTVDEHQGPSNGLFQGNNTSLNEPEATPGGNEPVVDEWTAVSHNDPVSHCHWYLSDH